MNYNKSKTCYVCEDCGAVSYKWQGQCSHCSSWNTLVESLQRQKNSPQDTSWAPTKDAVYLDKIPNESLTRLSTGIDEFDRVLGGGLVEGSVVLVGGDPGIGKSTLLLQALAFVSQNHAVLYVTGEESVAQVGMRARRLGVQETKILLLAEVDLEHICSVIDQKKPSLVVIDSIQTLNLEILNSTPGSVAQVRECATQLTRIAKKSGTSVVFIGHVTKEGTLAGPRVLEHMVDTVLYFEGDSHSSYRLIRAFKNRFGSVNELGVFGMTEQGLKGIANPSALFLSQHISQVSGSCILATQEGSRPILVEIQALVDTAHIPNPRRLSVGLEQNRLAMLLAVLHKHTGTVCYDQDIFINAVSGIRITEPAADLAVILAILSSLKNLPLSKGLVVFGEVGLAGEIRPAPRGLERLREAEKLGFSRIFMPRLNVPKTTCLSSDPNIEIVLLDRIDQAIAAAWE